MKTLYRLTRVYTLSHPAVGEWILVDGRHIERVGTGEPPGGHRLVELPGATAIPGFIDTHVHLTGTGLSGVGIPIERARSADELLGLVAEELNHEPAKILAHGFDESHWERRSRLRSAQTVWRLVQTVVTFSVRLVMTSSYGTLPVGNFPLTECRNLQAPYAKSWLVPMARWLLLLKTITA